MSEGNGHGEGNGHREIPAAARDAAQRPLEFIDRRLGTAPAVRFGLRYIFPDHWSFQIGEIALYSFIFLIATGTYLALFFTPDVSTHFPYAGSYAPLLGQSVSPAYQSALNISLDVPAGLVIRQAHHWAALLFVAAIVVHLLRILLTGAFRRPREINYLIGVTMLVLGILEGFLGYSLGDDLLSGIGLEIGYGVAMAIPVIGADFAFLVWGGEFPGPGVVEPRMYIAHVFIFPLILFALIGLHLVQIMRQKHSQFPGPGRRERNVVGSPLWPAYTLRTTGLLLATAAVLVLLGGLVQVNPIWQWGPFEPYLGTNGAQPDWYLGWLIGALRLMPNFEPHLLGFTIPNPFFAGILYPGVIFGLLYLWPWIDRRLWGDDRRHDLLDRPRDNPRRSATVWAVFSLVAVIFAAGSADRIFVSLGFGYEAQVIAFRVLAVAVPILVFFGVRSLCRGLVARESHPLRDAGRLRVRRNAAGGWEAAPPEAPGEPPVAASPDRDG